MSSSRALRDLAAAHGVQTTYRDTTGRRRSAEPGALLAVLAALGEPIERPEEAPAALERLRDTRGDRPIEPVLVAWDGRWPDIEVRLPARAPSRLRVRVELEGGQERAWTTATEDVRIADRSARLRVDGDLPLGRHEVTVEVGRRVGAAAILAAPRRVAAVDGARGWGVFLPLHALVTDRGWGIGDLAGLAELADVVRDAGGSLVATLPLLAGFPGEPSPYRPASRLFWNEVYVDVTGVPGVRRNERARRRMRSASFGRELAAVREGTLVDHGRVLALKRRVLEALAGTAGDHDGFRRFRREHPELEAYARFRAAGERLGRDWRAWPPRARAGTLRPSDAAPEAVAYHRFAQWVAEEQMAELGRRSGLLLDMPLGVHPDGFDVWRHRSVFADGVSVGAPPDDFFPGGQDWGMPPLHPERVREDGYAYPIACLRHVFRHAGVARVDHAIGLHRQYWIPRGMAADRGVFVRYPAEEWYAAISLEAHRAGTVVVGEDLGTVPNEIRAAMHRHRLLRSYVLQLEAHPERRPVVPEPPARSLATVNTHDLPTFAAYWRAATVREELVRALVGAGCLAPADGEDERSVLAACLTWLASSEARLVVVTLEDLWGELRPQNVPGTRDRPNFRRRAARSLEELRTSPDVIDLFRRVDAARRDPARRGAALEGDAA